MSNISEPRPLNAADYHKGFLTLLGQLTSVGDVDEGTFRRRFEEIASTPGYHVYVIEDTDTNRSVI